MVQTYLVSCGFQASSLSRTQGAAEQTVSGPEPQCEPRPVSSVCSNTLLKSDSTHITPLLLYFSLNSSMVFHSNSVC